MGLMSLILSHERDVSGLSAGDAADGACRAPRNLALVDMALEGGGAGTA
jgi:hypothetical protein